MIIEQFVNSSTAFTGCSSGRLRIVFLQLAEDGFTVIDTCAASAHIVLFASLGNAFLHFVVRCHDLSTLSASAMRHLAFCVAEMQCISLGTQGHLKVVISSNNDPNAVGEASRVQHYDALCSTVVPYARTVLIC